ncbi:protein tyrosine/serine phosphatase [Barrientosiimonas humi]|uniref:Protein tyrosine/serine phosphatase n=2 Tax=Barrientosiimonas TaxID=1535207 RepID=A0A542XGD1_9MICO|nr:protein tyrosine/serine phosphatase [Barrientosiimonas humi]BDZ60020.1 C4-dicarboxylate ABC transporter [Barrientosiimonas endolithica]CAG7571066.1 Tyrosine-protein phosphatase [Barrientosiimonas humi]
MGPVSPAWIDLDGLANMRDLGGTPLADGGEVQPGRLLRSDNLQTLTPADVEELVERRGVTDIVDLRSDVELQLTGPGPLVEVESLTHHHHSFFRERKVAVEDALVLPWRDADARRAEPKDANHWTSHYLGYLADRPDSVSNALRVVAEAEGAAVVHCAAGKDRTGTVVAMALSVAGASDEVISADYLATGERIERVVERLMTIPAYADNLSGRALAEHTPSPDTMPRLLAAIRDTAGSVEGWLRQNGWTEADVAQLRARLTRP